MQLEICDRPVFVLGCPRSGTSMLQWALRQHPRLWGGQESDFLIAYCQRAREIHELGTSRGRRHWLSGQGVTADEFLRHLGIGINSLYTARSGGRRWVEQTPSYTLHVDTIRMLFPDAQFLMIVRDGRQVVHSLRNFVNPMEHEEACHTWFNYTTAGLRAADRLGTARMRVVRYERIVQDPTNELKEIHEFLDEPFEPATADFIRNRPINSSFAGESSQDKLRDRWISWTDHERAIFMQVAGGLLVELGFVEDHAWTREPPTPSCVSTQP